ncbi:HpcH/HpaI aldolase/citrate lyase family protein [Legionella micdadei]|uniref:(S)-citramalyl-CoA lyase n=1 Tax=Legionella micdadei TaxID=451 RepID=A0A098GFF5_LEGMI|nr:aldolase/citrate lyase family protein [Legionella micdadei]ARG98127.1 CoA ester lyase [Legionella micdadei]ARH00925.1 CoA ester lyase [Legionella micdadei]KTD30029.1 citrate lyase beta subunit [Legionella micdadei]NSL18592.1 CoA ester lyase [Legionella micdadei]CEG60221.1 Citrase lyase beta subunit [Legionella micdadei]
MDLSISPALLFTPGNKPERFSKALVSEANGLILELEDAVPLEDKKQARDNVVQFLLHNEHANLPIIVRINHITSDAGLADLLALKQTNLSFDAIMYPKAESAEELNIIYETLHLEARKIKLFALIETSKGIHQLTSIVTNSPVAGLFFGAADYAVDVGCHLSWEALLFARLQLIQAAALTHIPAIDSPFFDFANEKELIAETIKAKELGFKGKLAIHPKQIAPIKKQFAPTEEQIDRAKKIIALFEQAGGKACQHDGEMIDVPIYNHAQKLLHLAKNIKRNRNG